MSLNKKQTAVLRELTDEGYAVILWNPEELGDVSPVKLEERSIEFGWQYIESEQSSWDEVREINPVRMER